MLIIRFGKMWQQTIQNQTTVKLVSFVARTHEDAPEKEPGRSIPAILACLQAEFCTYNIKISKARTMYLNYLRFLPAGYWHYKKDASKTELYKTCSDTSYCCVSIGRSNTVIVRTRKSTLTKLALLQCAPNLPICRA